MAAMFTFDITRDGDDETVRVPATSRDVSHWERTVKGAALANLEKPRMSDLEQIAYLAAVRRGLFEGKLSEFRESCDVVMVPEEDLDEDDLNEGGPTRPAL